MSRFFLFFSILILFLMPFHAFADDGLELEYSRHIKSAGEPESYDLDIYGDFGIKDIWTRQLQYKHSADKFSRQLRKRQALFSEPRNIALRNYLVKRDQMLYGEDGRVEVVGDKADMYLPDPDDQ